ncbi:OB-fold protein [Maridesulfovibrio sp. FT414]|uniref:OB-fold protein n=1 Tax=Maridesulfovibrio sp. FT414 TaxID=2979469 RepID=UPI003D8054AA
MKNIVKAEEFQLVDPMGRVRTRIYLSDEGKVVADVYDSSGEICNKIDLQKPPVQGPTAQQPKQSNGKENLSQWHTRIANEVQLGQSKLHVGSYKLYIDFMENNTMASGKYLNEVIEVSGEIVEVVAKDFGNLRIGLKGMSNFTAEVICHFTDDQTTIVSNLKPGQKVRVKGKCTEFVNKRVKVWGCHLV